MIEFLPVNNRVAVTIGDLRDALTGALVSDLAFTIEVFDSTGASVPASDGTVDPTTAGSYGGYFDCTGLTIGQRYKVVISDDDGNIQWVRWFYAQERPTLSW